MIKSMLGGSAMFLGVYGYIPYARDIMRGRTRPHAFSWFVWSIMSAIAFFAQVSEKGGPGSWVMGFTAFACFMFFLAALRYGEKKITNSDWLCLGGAGLAIVFWGLTNGPLLSVILITLIDALGFAPTFRKSYTKPYEETLSTYLLSAIKFVIAIIALDAYNVITVLYPLSLVIANGAFVVMLYVRRKQLPNPILQLSSTGN